MLYDALNKEAMKKLFSPTLLTTGKKLRGFTLVELLVSITIIAILAALGTAVYTEASKSARNAKRKSDMEMVRQALVLRKSQTGNYGSAGNFSGIVTNMANYYSGPTPADPLTSGHAQYSGGSTGAVFCACATMEGTNLGNAPAGSCTAPNWTVTFATGNLYCVVNP